MTKIVYGIVHGRTIEFDEDLGVAEGQEVEVHIKVISPPARWARASCAQRVRWRTIPSGTESWSRSTKNAKVGSNDQGNARNRSREDHRSDGGSWYVGRTSR